MSKLPEWLATGLRIVGSAVVGASVAPLTILLVSTGARTQDLWELFGHGMIYALCICTLAWLVMPRAARRPPEWCRTPRLQQGMILGALVLVAFTGSVLASTIICLAHGITGRSAWMVYWTGARISTAITLALGWVQTYFEIQRGRLAQAEAERQKAIRLATEAQLASLESQIHPHFLFNTLNSISALIPEDPRRAERLIERMAALLRYSLDAPRKGLVPLAREMQIVAGYMEIEKARLGPRLSYSLEIPPALESADVPPLSVQTLVENSIKHVVAPARGGGKIRVRATMENGRLRLEVTDSGQGVDLAVLPAGHGLDNLRLRLENLFGLDAGLRSTREDDSSTMAMLVPQSEPAQVAS